MPESWEVGAMNKETAASDASAYYYKGQLLLPHDSSTHTVGSAQSTGLGYDVKTTVGPTFNALCLWALTFHKLLYEEKYTMG